MNRHRGFDIAVDSSGNVYVTGYHNGSSGIVIAKYNNSLGVIQWQKVTNGGYEDRGHGIEVDSSGNIYIVVLNLETILVILINVIVNNQVVIVQDHSHGIEQELQVFIECRTGHWICPSF